MEPDQFMAARLKELIDQGHLNQYVHIVNGTSSDIVNEEFFDTFDTFIYIDILEHVENDRKELEQASRLIKRLIII